MLPTSFANSLPTRPTLKPTLEKLELWVRRHKGLGYIDLRRVVSEVADLEAGDLVMAVVALEDEGILREKFGFVSPHNDVLVDEFFDSPDDPTGPIFDTADRPFDPDDAEIVSVYVGPDQ